MAGSTFGKQFRITTWGESHGEAVGVVIDGCPAGLPLCEEDIQTYLDRRRPQESPYSTSRKEADRVRILSGLWNGCTTGTPLSLQIQNTDARPASYDQIASVFRPGHADFTYTQKFGIRDPRGGGRASGRETAGRVAAGAIAAKILAELRISVYAYTESIGPIRVTTVDPEERDRNPLAMPDREAAKRAGLHLDSLIREGDSAGGIIACRADGLPAGIGEPVFDKLDAELAKAVLSIGAVKGVEFGAGFEAALHKGSENNDAFYTENGRPAKRTNHAGGILGGISDGASLFLRAAIKPTPSISRTQETMDEKGQSTCISIQGRHDPVIVPRAVVVVESMVALTLVDALLAGMGSRLEYLKKIWSE